MPDTLEDLTMQIAQVVPCTEAEGPGKRFALWFQGCPLRCPGCCNPEFLPFKGGQTKSLREMTEWLARTREESGIEGITCSWAASRPPTRPRHWARGVGFAATWAVRDGVQRVHD